MRRSHLYIAVNAKNVTPQVTHVEGDPDHPTNCGTLCPKDASLQQDILNPRRLGLKTGSVGFVQLLLEHAELRRLVSQSKACLRSAGTG